MLKSINSIFIKRQVKILKIKANVAKQKLK